MGGHSSSSNSNQTETVSGSVGIDGDNTGFVLSGVKGSTVNVTDGGAVKSALTAMTNMSDNVTSMAKQMSSDSKDISIRALVNAESATTDAMDIMKNLSLNSDAGTAQEMSKYFTLGAVAIAVAFVLKGKF